MSTLRDIGEDALVARLVPLLPMDPDPLAGPGDDCAVVDPGPGHDSLLLLKTDALVERIHFLPDAPARAVGWKSVARVVSDFAAMGGRPERFLITLAMPPETRVAWVEELYHGIGNCLRALGGTLAGGETSSVPSGSVIVISIAATGTVGRSNLVLRSTGRVGDTLLVTGNLGGSIRGKHLEFTPRTQETNWLVSNFKPSAMMDLSDGLAKDLPRMAAASGCGFVVDESRIPCSPGSDLAAAVGDGEDFEMLMAMEPGRVGDLLVAWSEKFPDLPLSVIGSLVEKGGGASLHGGWDHFSPIRG